MSSLWLSLEPRQQDIRLMLSRAGSGTILKARLPAFTADPRALGLLLESLAAWMGEPLVAVLDGGMRGRSPPPGILEPVSQ